MGQADSKLLYRQNLIRLTEEQAVSLEDNAYWASFWSAPTSVDDVFSLSPPSDIRKIISQSPINLRHFITLLIQEFAAVVKDGQTPVGKAELPKLLNIVRILTRFLPFVFEDRQADWQKNLFLQPATESGEITFADRLVDSLLISLFLPGVTLPENVARRKDGTFAIIWETGVGASSAPASTQEIDASRTELLNLFLVFTSQILYGDSHKFRTQGVFFIDLILKRVPKTTLMALLGSLINIVVQYDPIGVGLPYNYFLFADTRESLVQASLHVLLVLLDYRYPFDPKEPKSPMSPENSNSNAPPSKNLFQDYFSRIHRQEDFNVIIVGLGRLLNNPLVSSNAYLPGSYKTIQFHQELVFFTWKLLELNKRFVSYLVQDALLLDILLPILVYAIEARLDEGKQGLVHVTCFLLLLLSGERNFGVRLNKTYTSQIPRLLLPSFEGNHADVLILVLHKLITDCDKGKLFSLFDCMLTVIANISPYVKSLSSVTCHKLLSLFRSFTSSRFLLANSTNHNFSAILLDAFNNMIQYQFDGNVRLVYAILRQKELFERLSDFDLETALQQLQEKDSKKQGDHEIDPNHIIDPDSEHPKDPEAPQEVPKAPSSPREMVSMAVDKQKQPQFIPTEEWVRTWKRSLPLNTVIRLLNVLTPQIEKICVERGIVSEDEILKYLQSGTLVGLLPVPHPIMIRRYKPNQGTYAWATIFMWGVIYLRNLNPPIWFGTKVDLFIVKQV